MAGNFGTCFGCNGRFLCFEGVVRVDKQACRLHSMHPACLNLEVAVGQDIFALCPCGEMGNRAWFKVIAGQVSIPPPPEAPPLVPGDDDGFDPHGMALAIMGAGGHAEERGGDVPVVVVDMSRTCEDCGA
ncbi:unnamed protein product [Allacma fusca]|uniref:Uncharacterized protein n=1 Tax=Allacma fusca TaxID=39272 RepID=A0A8J2JDM0_9HEXA|nr:unnamed protein product [Allacma fusca]